jgi:hypothetical protein
VKYKLSWPLAVLLLSASAFAQTKPASQSLPPILHNNDVLLMVQEGVKPGEIIARIVTSRCEFDTFPPVLQDLGRRGVPETVVMAMKMVPYGPPATPSAGIEKTVVAPATRVVEIPPGTVIRLEAAKRASSANAEKGTPISFVVSRRVFVDGVLAIDRGAVAMGRVIKSKPAASWGRGGTLEFAIEDVLAVDGGRVPIKLSKGMKGSAHTTAVTAAAVATGALIFPYTSPVALIWALKKGDDAVLDQGTKLTAVVRNKQEVAGLLPEKKQPVYHSLDSINDADRSQAQGLKTPFNNSFRPTSIHNQ